MGWNDLEQRLATSPHSRGGAADEADLRAYFGDQEYEYLRKLAAQSRQMRARAVAKGNIVLLPGIMGSELTATEAGDGNLIWVNAFRLITGRLADLRLAPDGKREADAGINVAPTALEKRTYARTVLWLRARWNVEPFPYDWRKDLDQAAHALARFIVARFGHEPVDLVAHSMGGLVSRNFIRLYPELWEKMRGAEGNRGGRLIMLGTPNYGSFAIPQVLTGVEKMLRWLERIDLSHNMSELLEVIDSFVGCYQMLPSPEKIPVSTQRIYQRDSWGNYPVSESHLLRAMEFHTGLATAARTMDPERMVYVAGCNRQTISGLQIVARGEFEYTTTLAGDGRVPHALGLLPNLPTYYLEETHGDLPRNERLLGAIEELLERGRTSALSTEAPVMRTTSEETRWRRPAIEHRVGDELEIIARRIAEDEASAEEIRYLEEVQEQAAIGRSVRAPQPSVPVAIQAAKRRKVEQPFPLRVEVLLGDVTQVRAPLLVVGRYNGTLPVAALGALDRALGYWISRAGEQGMIGSDLGELFFIPVPRGVLGTPNLMLAGLGDPGRFTREDLRYLMMNVTTAASGLKLDHMATVLIGTGNGGLARDRAVRGYFNGVADALARIKPAHRLRQLTIVERDPEIHRQIHDLLLELCADSSCPNLDLEIRQRKLPTGLHRRPEAAKPQDLPEPDGPRITIERNGETFRFSALTLDAVVPVRDVPVQIRFANGVAERLISSATADEQAKYGRLLYTYLMPEDFQRLLAEGGPLTLVLDPSTASFPWEMACFSSARGQVFLGPDLQLARQFRTMLSSPPGVAPLLSRSLKVLVIADPAPEPELQLPGARREGREVVRVLEDFKHRAGLDLQIVQRIGAVECDPVEILAFLLGQEFDIVHFAGHGVFDQDDPNLRGWVFGRDLILGAREMFRARQVARLVFANACFSAVVRPGRPPSPDDLNRQLAGLAEAFFERGVQNYVGSGWPVDDTAAVTFARNFYQRLLVGETLGDSLSAARKSIFADGSTWGAYQHYGRASVKLVPASVAATQRRPATPPPRPSRPAAIKVSDRSAARPAVTATKPKSVRPASAQQKLVAGTASADVAMPKPLLKTVRAPSLISRRSRRRITVRS